MFSDQERTDPQFDTSHIMEKIGVKEWLMVIDRKDYMIFLYDTVEKRAYNIPEDVGYWLEFLRLYDVDRETWQETYRG
jgi:hypothetical protein